MKLYYELRDSFYSKAVRTPIKLDVDYEVSLQGDKFLVTLRFVNSGDDTLVLESPATWDGTFPYPQFPVGAAAELEGNLNFLLAGEQMVNANEFPDDEMIILPGQSREARFLAVPTGKGKKGAAPSGGRVAMYVKQPKAIVGSVDFYVINRARAMPRDYPATVSEWEAWEAEHRRLPITSIGVAAGSAVKEDGYYRALVDAQGGPGRVAGRDVRLFRQGDVAPPIDREVDERGRSLSSGEGARFWLWQADASSVVEAKSGASCPKSGRWRADVTTALGSASELNPMNTAIRVEYGARMPSFGFNDPSQEARVVWRWIGP